MRGGERYRQLHFPFSVKMSFSVKKTGKKVHDCYPSYFTISHASTKFHYYQTNNKKKMGVRP